ncbi:MAG: anaerobic ribonucleoside-triphosphate reductase activating protein [candidate division Zixibacteria bacterium]|nr:anaerobic ribonucleoside-triphosphate reductase activating protein [candidate division Zixibacteria bacterium]
MIIGGLQHLSLIDYPGVPCAVLFTRGCNFRCHYCHNPELVVPEQFGQEVPLAEVYGFLKLRQGKLQAVCVTGGEPTLHLDLPDMLRKIKSLDYLVKLDTNGSQPEFLERMFDDELLDYVAMDIKAPLADYEKITGVHLPQERLARSIEAIITSGIEYEFRTTIVTSLTTKDDIRHIARTIRGARRYYLQAFVPTKMLDSRLRNEHRYSSEELTQLAKELETDVQLCGVRNMSEMSEVD